MSSGELFRQPFAIRAAGPGDTDALFALILELARFESLEHQVSGSAVQLALDLFGPSARAWATVATVEELVVGYALCFSTYSTFLTRPGVWLEDLYVSEKQRGRGIGRALFDAVAEQAKAQGAGRLEWSVLDWNQKAIDFYEERGATVLPDWRICRMTRQGEESEL